MGAVALTDLAATPAMIVAAVVVADEIQPVGMRLADHQRMAERADMAQVQLKMRKMEASPAAVVAAA